MTTTEPTPTTLNADDFEGELRQILHLLRDFPGTADLAGTLMDGGNVTRLQTGELDATSFFHGLQVDLGRVLALVRVLTDAGEAAKRQVEQHQADRAATRRYLGLD